MSCINIDDNKAGIEQLHEGVKVKRISDKLSKISFKDEETACFYKIILPPMLSESDDIETVYVSGNSLYVKLK